MLGLLMGYVLIGIAILIPLLLLASVVWVLIHPLSLEEVEGQHAENKQGADAGEGDEAKDPRIAPPGGSGRAA